MLIKIFIWTNYGEPIYDQNNKLLGYKINDNEYALVLATYFNRDNFLCNSVSVRDITQINEGMRDFDLISWLDIKTDFGFIREYSKKKYFYDNNNNLINVEVKYSYPSLPSQKKDGNLDLNFGAIDLETYGSNFGIGHHQVYAGGWVVKNNSQSFYIKPNETSEQLVNRLFLSILMNPNFNGYTFYVHNLGRFDSVFIIKSLITNKSIKLIPIWKDNSIISLKIKFNKIEITLLDSLQLISGSLKDILISFECEAKKGYFPYSFVNKDNLYYIGDKPSKFYFNVIPDLEYNNIQNTNWDLKKETLKYLKSDVLGLFEVITKFSNIIYNKYQLNITKFKTLPGLALAVYRSSYLPEHLKPEIKMVKGELENEFRSTYFGGNVDVFINEVIEGYLYDLNSQYPAAMLNDMPIGNPTLSLETNLDKIFGFVYGEIYCPNEQALKVPFIQYKDPITNNVSCPRGKFKRLIFSPEIKYALKYGYKIDIEYCYLFEKGKDLFKDYVLDHFEIKRKSIHDPIQRSSAKLFLNALYGRFGMKDIENFIKIVDKNEAEFLDKNTNVTVISELTDNKYMIRYNGQINDNIRKLYKKDPLTSFDQNKTITYTKEQLRKSGLNKKQSTPSAVHIAAAIASYARILINEYKNIPDNPCIMSDTDSAVLPYPLSDHLVGGELGQMKLVCKIKHGIFIKKKFYCILDSDNKEIIKSSGIDSSRLSYESFKKLLNGESITIERTNFNVNWKDLSINVINSNIIVQGLKGGVKTLNNTSNPNKIENPNLIVKNNKVNKDITKLTTLEIFIYFIFIFSYLSLIALFLYKIY